MGLLSLDNRLYRLVDAEVDHLVTVVGEDDVNEVFANVMNIAFHRRDQELGLG